MHDERETSAENGPMGKKLEYPKAVFFIISTEFCERFSFFGMRAILSLYLSHKLDYTDDEATVLFHTFNMLVFLSPLIGGILGDSVIGKFRMIFYLSIVYSIGQLLLAACAIPNLGLPRRELTLFGLFIIGLGSGGIKPCVPAMGADQFVLPQQEKSLSSFSSIFFFTMYCGALISVFLAPELRTEIGCFGEQECYSLAFLVPAILMVSATIIFRLGKPLYRMKNPERNMFFDVFRCIWCATINKLKKRDNKNHDHWLDYARSNYDKDFIADVKEYLRITKLFLPLPVFWTLLDIQGSRWTFQATRMNGELGSFIIKPDQMLTFNLIMIMGCIPFFEKCLYPVLHRIRAFREPLIKVATGSIFIVLAFVFSAILEIKLEATYPVLPATGNAQVRIFNPRDCHLPITINDKSTIMEPFGVWLDTGIKTNKTNVTIPFTADFSYCSGQQNVSGFITAADGQATSCVLEPLSVYSYKDFINKTKTGKPAIRVLTFNTLSPTAVTEVKLSKTNNVFKTIRSQLSAAQVTSPVEFLPGKYDVEVNGRAIDEITIKHGGVYTLQAFITANSTNISLSTITPQNSIHILWQLPQCMAYVVADILCLIPGYNFILTRAPASMKSLVMSFWLVTNSFAHIIVIAITSARIGNRLMYEFLLYAGMVVLAAVVFITLITNYHSAEDEKIKRNGSAVTGMPMELDNSENLTRDSTITRL